MDQKYIELYDDYTHGTMGRRAFIDRLIKLAGGSAVAMALLPSLENNYALAGNPNSATRDVLTEYVEFEGASGKVRGFLARPKVGPEFYLPSVVVIHENRGLNPHIEDVARRAAAAGFVALAPDALSPLGGTPKDVDEARNAMRKLDSEKTLGDFLAAVAYLANKEVTYDDVGCVGFCWGGRMANQIAVHSEYMKAAVAFYGSQPTAEEAAKIKGAVMLHYAGLDERINKGIDAYKAALKTAGVEHEVYIYDGVNHAFHNDTNAARYNKEAAELAWERTIGFWKKHLMAKKKPDKPPDAKIVKITKAKT
ncbi:MAG: dienelactone hydrolase family protein [Acidobacteriota bacterium]|nr:dienelactone hydrolase family protein [Acidobacteriota bacterium]